MHMPINGIVSSHAWGRIIFLVRYIGARVMHWRLAHDLQSVSVALDNGQNQVRRVRGIVVDSIDRLDEILLGLRFDGSPRIGIAIKAWEV